jgi:hypothetical protein
MYNVVPYTQPFLNQMVVNHLLVFQLALWNDVVPYAQPFLN